MSKKYKTICIIPARGGSKGLKNKNIQKVNGIPLIAYPIKAALKSKVCDMIFVSTDSKEIANTAKKFGAFVPFLRPKKFAKDRTTTEATLKNALHDIEKYTNQKYDICVFLTSNNIFRDYRWIITAVNNLKNDSSIDSSFSVHDMYKHFWHYDNKKLKKVLPWMKSYTSRQIAPKLYREDTSLACATRSKFWRSGKRIGKNVKLIINDISFTSIDIHNKSDLDFANIAMRHVLKNKILKPY